PVEVSDWKGGNNRNVSTRRRPVEKRLNDRDCEPEGVLVDLNATLHQWKHGGLPHRDESLLRVVQLLHDAERTSCTKSLGVKESESVVGHVGDLDQCLDAQRLSDHQGGRRRLYELSGDVCDQTARCVAGKREHITKALAVNHDGTGLIPVLDRGS